jgi:hypothetical protein
MAAEDDRIAIIGYSCILPGGENVCESWETIKASEASTPPAAPTCYAALACAAGVAQLSWSQYLP